MNRILVLLLTMLLLPATLPLVAQDVDHTDTSEHEPEDPTTAEHHDDEFTIEITPDAMQMVGLSLAKVTRGSIGTLIDLPGEVGFDEDRLVHIVPRFPGIVREARFRLGDRVNKGDVVVIVESNESMSTYTIEAPIPGRVIDKHVIPGEFVSEEHVMYVIADLSNVWVNLAVRPKDADRIKPGQKVFLEAIGSDSQAEGIIEYVTPILDVSTRSMTARIVLPNNGNKWRPGTFVHAQVSTDPGEEGLVVLKEAVQVLDNENVVFISEGPGKFKPVEVVVGESDDRYTKILSGLTPGMEYAATGAFELKAKIVTSNLGDHAGHGH